MPALILQHQENKASVIWPLVVVMAVKTTIPDAMKIGDQTGDGGSWEHYSDLSRTNSYTGKGGSKRD